jgi:diketogulonate reductase-like aldo/keto reductase
MTDAHVGGISTKATFPFGKGPNDAGSSRYHLVQACEGSLKRLGTDYIDIYHMHTFAKHEFGYERQSEEIPHVSLSPNPALLWRFLHNCSFTSSTE